VTHTTHDPPFGRSRRKKANKIRQGLTGKKQKVGSPFEESSAKTCPRYDFGKHRRCTKIKRADGTRICNCRERGPPGSNKRAEGERSPCQSSRLIFRTPCTLTRSLVSRAWKERAKKREEKKALKAAVEKGGEEPPSEWLPIDGWWAAYAIDGKGYHDGDGKYRVLLEVAEFGERFFLGGKARFTGLPPTGLAPPGQTFDLPDVMPANGIVKLGPILFAAGAATAT
jgi:hypothetical protein